MIAGRRVSKLDAQIGRRIYEERLRKEMSQSELGRKIGVTFQQVQKYEKGLNRVSAGRLLQIAKAFGIHYSVLFEGMKDIYP